MKETLHVVIYPMKNIEGWISSRPEGLEGKPSSMPSGVSELES